jgi:hypothetical protein
MFWSLLISLTIFSFIGDVDMKFFNLRRVVTSPIRYHSAVWGYGAFCAIIPLCFDGAYGNSGGGVCLFVFSELISKVLSLMFLWVNIWGTIVIIIILSYITRGKLSAVLAVDYIMRAELSDSDRPHGPSKETQHIIEMHDQLKWYPIILIIGWSIDSSTRLYQIVTGTDYSDMPKWSVDLFTLTNGCSLQAILNAVAYGLTPTVRSKWFELFSEIRMTRSVASFFKLQGSLKATVYETFYSPVDDEDGVMSLRESISRANRKSLEIVELVTNPSNLERRSLSVSHGINDSTRLSHQDRRLKVEERGTIPQPHKAEGQIL